MDAKTIILIFCVVDITLGFWCLTLSLQNLKLEKEEKKFKKGINKDGK